MYGSGSHSVDINPSVHVLKSHFTDFFKNRSSHKKQPEYDRNVYLIKTSDFLIYVSVYTKLDKRGSNSWL